MAEDEQVWEYARAIARGEMTVTDLALLDVFDGEVKVRAAECALREAREALARSREIAAVTEQWEREEGPRGEG